MARERVEMHQLQELVRLHRMRVGARAVAALVRELSGPRIDLLSNAARAYSADLSTSAVRPLPRTRAMTDPDRTTRLRPSRSWSRSRRG